MTKLYSVLTVATIMPLCLLAGQESQASQADEYNPEVRNFQVREGEYRIAQELVKNAKSLPANTVYKFVSEPIDAIIDDLSINQKRVTIALGNVKEEWDYFEALKAEKKAKKLVNG